jgi:threonine synthase
MVYFTHIRHFFQMREIPTTGITPLLVAENLAKRLGIDHVYLKDETKNPSGSFKDRALAEQIGHYQKKGETSFVISSSGNAAVAAALFASVYKVSLDIFVSTHIAKYKLQRLDKMLEDHPGNKVGVHHVEDPKGEAREFAIEKKAILLNGSKDDIALEGYKSLGDELLMECEGKSIQGIFMPVSSGTGLLGMNQALQNMYPMYAIQTPKHHSIVDAFNNEVTPTATSKATAISITYSPRTNEVLEALRDSHGGAYSISDEELDNALSMLQVSEHTTASYDSLLSIAGLIKALQDGKPIKNAICILTGI